MDSSRIADVFRRWGHLQAQVDSFGRIAKQPHAELDEATQSDADIWRQIYCGPIGAEFMHMPFPERCNWVASRMEGSSVDVDREYVLRRLASAELFESYIHTRYVGSKRFSLEGLAAAIPLLDEILDTAANRGFESVIIGMSHRGRLNVMVHITGLSPQHIFANFEDVDPRAVLGSGDVKYHKGATGKYTTRSGKEIMVRVASNPSHLEVINPVIQGRVRAHQDRRGDTDHKKVLAILLHGDAAFAGQGITAETLNLADVRGFSIGGTVHIVINNLIGFTATPDSYSSSRYATDVAKRLPVPIWHVNAERPNDVIRVGHMAMDYRAEFATDVIIDLIGYRKYGHSEIDDPTITSPVLYKDIQNRPPLHEEYAQQMGISGEQLEGIKNEITEHFKEEHEVGRSMIKQPEFRSFPQYWKSFYGGYYDPKYEVTTNISPERVKELATVITSAPEGFSVNTKLQRLLDDRMKMGLGEKPIDYGMAEALAYGSLLWEGKPVRLSGQDCRRGTFAHRHAVLVDTETGEDYYPLQHLHENQGRFEVYDSILSEAAVLGFEYGYSRDYPDALVLWEAQFGDFANGAQIIMDQFIAAGEDKWSLLSGVTLLLPHGFEGQGPEHSSARLERYLQLAAEDNFQVCQPSTAGQHFHLLRRQGLRKWMKPLVVMTPKSMLRAKVATSPLEKITDGSFENVIDDPEITNAERILFCSGKIVHELRAERAKRKVDNIAIVSVEQLYPFPKDEIIRVLDRLPMAKQLVWVQEEPANMGALTFIRPLLKSVAMKDQKVTTVRRSESASPATGSPKAHSLEQQAIIRLAFTTYD